MKKARSLTPAVLLCSTLVLVAGTCLAQVNVTTYHNDNSRTGANTAESTLTSGVISNTFAFGQRFQFPVDAEIYGQPLVLSNVTIGTVKHNVVYVATENDSVYAIDASTGAPYWQVSLGTPELSNLTNPGGSMGTGCANILPYYGITSTPVINPAPSSGPPVLYVVAENGAEYQLHALSAQTGSDLQGVGPVTISGTYAGVSFSPLFQLIRPALLLENNHVIVAAGSHCDSGPWYGWVFSYNASTLALEAVFMTEPSGTCGGIWMSGSGVAADSAGNLYFATGNSEQRTAPDYGNSIIKLPPPPTPPTVWDASDYFTPSAQNLLSGDNDVGSGGVILIPGTSELVGMGKEGVLYLVNQQSMGHYCGYTSTVTA